MASESLRPEQQPPAETSKLRLAVKDNIAVTGLPTTCASKMLTGAEIPFTATIAAQLRDRGGMEVVAKAGMDEFGMGTHSTTSAFGVVHNARPLERYSAGAARAAAPWPRRTACCRGGGSCRDANSLDTVGLLARDVRAIREAVVGLRLHAEHDPRDPTSLPESVRSRCTAEREGYDFTLPAGELPTQTTLKGLTFGLPLEYNIRELDARIRQGWLQALETIQKLGGRVVPVSLPSTTNALSAYYVIAPAEASSNLAKYDGIRYGYRDTDEPSDAQDGVLYARTRGSGFGSEVKRHSRRGLDDFG
ncbi:hypothetical protein CIB48_g10726 [Xylaria polymorpha]|nr:hypothetical protein CIB48_g10726 [Xylaria polymorpha]